jgi:signal transduction histidine kinase
MVESLAVNQSERSAAGLDFVSSQRMDAVSELVRRVSHDYNNLFGIVIATLGILKEDIEAHPEISQLEPLLSDALSASKEGTDLMDRLLACTGYQLLSPESVDVTKALDELKLLWAGVLPDEISLEIMAESDLPCAYVDPQALNNTLAGLLENAREAMPSGGMIRISAARHDRDTAGDAVEGRLPPGRYLSIAVSDTGDGIEPSLLGRVLEPFVTTKQPAKGRGFGLSRSYGFAKQSRGRLFLESLPNRGTTVTLVVPTAGSDSG